MKLLKKVLSIILIAVMMFSVISCDNDNGETPSDDKDPNKYTVTVKSPLGKPLSGVTVYVHKDGEGDYNVCTLPALTDAEGKATFTLDPTFNYSVQLANLPPIYSALSGYNPSERYAFDSNDITVTVDLSDDYSVESYRIGDYMANFEITDIDGNRYELYSLLREKKVVVLNFWYYGCPPCAAEFPALNSAYKENKDSVEVLAINDYYNDTDEHVRGYESYRGFTLDMPLFKTEYRSGLSIYRFPSEGWPTTVVIDRYGVISNIHAGAVTSSARWNELFAYYTSDSYSGTPFTDF